MAGNGTALESAALGIERALTGAVVRDLRRQDSIALAYSGGLDSSVLAKILADQSDVDAWLVTVGATGSRDVERARTGAEVLGLPLLEVPVSEARLERHLPEIVRLVGRTRVPPEMAERWGLPPGAEAVSPVVAAVEATLFFVFREAARHAHRVLLGQGADELFGGYKRYEGLAEGALRARMAQDLAALIEIQRPVEERVAAAFGVSPRYPYLDPAVVRRALVLPPESLVSGSERKRALRSVARRLGLPGAMVEVPKTAAQYGSGIARLVEGLAARQGRSPSEFLNALAAAA